MLSISLSGPLEQRLRELAQVAHTSPERYALEALEYFVEEYRSGKVKVDPSRHHDRHDDPLNQVVG